MESYRAYGALNSSTPQIDFEEIGSLDRAAVSVAGTALQGRLNTTFYSTITAPTFTNSAAIKQVAVTVDWTDRNNTFQSVELRSIVAGVPPEQVGSLAVPPAAEPFAASRGRHRNIPPAAFSLPGVGKSIFKPPQGGGGSLGWVFNNVTGLVVGLCNLTTAGTAESQAESCVSSSSATSAQLLSGYVRFAAGDPASGSEAEVPTGGTRNLDIVLSLTSVHPLAPACFDDASSDDTFAAARREVAYYCLIYSNDAGRWAGRTRIAPLASAAGGAWTIGSSGLTPSTVCRYTSLNMDAGTRNIDHPLDYTEAGSASGAGLANQNFLVVGASFPCPAETPAEGDLFNSNTRVHQDGTATYSNP